METEGESESDGLGVSGRGRERRGASIRLLAEPRRNKIVREGDAAVRNRPLRFGMRRRVVRTRPEQSRQPSRVVFSTRTFGRSRSRPGRSPYAAVATSSRWLP